ncbi:uncharacterized protein LOC143422588 [Xylocopa sonorina]|uniref:uncharacterized protein LOC143422588 n=1 Tax=Xylocopa sonorina TaxID=1818115 RepID=UPI00403A9E3C
MFKQTVKCEKVEKHKTWKLLSATDFNSLMYPCLFMSWLLGLFPYKCDSPTYKFSKVRFIFSTFAIFIYGVSLFALIYQVNFSTLISYDIPSAISNNLFLLLDGSIIVVMYILTGARVTVIRNLSKISSILSSEDFNDLAKIIHVKNLIGFLFLIVHLPNCFKDNILLTLRNIDCLYMLITNFTVDMFYMDCVCILKACFKRMDECLRQLKSQIDSESWAQSLAHREQKNLLLLIKLKNFEEKYLEISDVVQLLNNTFLIRNIIITASTFTVVTFNLYFLILYSNINVLVNIKFWYFEFSSPAAVYLFKFSLIIWACETATNQGRSIKTTVHDVFSEAIDPVTKREVELLSLQILHRNNTFTAKAIEMNVSLLSKILGGITMYILILFQFLLDSVICNSYAEQVQDVSE